MNHFPWSSAFFPAGPALSLLSATPMADAIKKVDKIRQIFCLKQVMKRWRHSSLRRHSDVSCSDSDTSESDPSRVGRTRSGSLAVYVGDEGKRFEIPIRFLNLPIFVGLLKKAGEEFGFQCNGGLVLPCEVAFFRELIKYLYKDENRFGKFSFEEFVKMLSDVGSDFCKETAVAFTPLLQKVRV